MSDTMTTPRAFAVLHNTLAGVRGIADGCKNPDNAKAMTERADELELAINALQAVDLRQLAWLLVNQAGGVVEIPHEAVQDYNANAAVLELEHFDFDNRVRVTARTESFAQPAEGASGG